MMLLCRCQLAVTNLYFQYFEENGVDDSTFTNLQTVINNIHTNVSLPFFHGHFYSPLSLLQQQRQPLF